MITGQMQCFYTLAVAEDGAVICWYNVLAKAWTGVAGSSEGSWEFLPYFAEVIFCTITKYKHIKCLYAFKQTLIYSWHVDMLLCAKVVLICNTNSVAHHFSFPFHRWSLVYWILRHWVNSSMSQSDKLHVFLADCFTEVSTLVWCNDNICKCTTMP